MDDTLRGLILVDPLTDAEQHELVRDALRERIDAAGIKVDYLWHSLEWARMYSATYGDIFTPGQVTAFVKDTAQGVDAAGARWFNAFFRVGVPRVSPIDGRLLHIALTAGTPVWWLKDTDWPALSVVSVVEGAKTWTLIG